MSLSTPLRSTRVLKLAHMRPTVPSVDFKPFLCGSAGDRQRIASEIDEALSSIGFIELRNHGVEQDKVDACFQWVCGITGSRKSYSRRFRMLIRSRLAEQTPLRPFRV